MTINSFIYHSVKPYIPYEKRIANNYKSDVDQSLESIQDCSRHIDAIPNKVYKYVVGGSLVFLGSLFILFAAHQILPRGINAISQIKPWGCVIGYGMLTGGFGTMLAGLVKGFILFKEEKKACKAIYKDLVDKGEEAVQKTIQEQLNANELLLVKDDEKYTLFSKRGIDTLQITAEQTEQQVFKWAYSVSPTEKHFLDSQSFNIWKEKVLKNGSLITFLENELERTGLVNF